MEPEKQSDKPAAEAAETVSIRIDPAPAPEWYRGFVSGRRLGYDEARHDMQFVLLGLFLGYVAATVILSLTEN